MRATWIPWLPAGALALLVGAVFTVLQGYGPENALRRFHVAAVNGDREGLRRASVEGAKQTSIEALRGEIAAIARTGAGYQVYRIQRSGSSAIAGVNYTRGRLSSSFLYVLRRQEGRWYVDPDASIDLMLQKYGPPGAAL